MRCTKPLGYGKCVVDMSPQESFVGAICCDTAGDLHFKKEDILCKCEYAEPSSINEAALKELYS